jgi:formylmethanofuran dehydrogenase subunit A
MFEVPRYVFKAGGLIVEQGEIRNVPFGPTWHATPEYDAGVVPDVKAFFEKNYSFSFDNYPVTADYTGWVPDR